MSPWKEPATPAEVAPTPTRRSARQQAQRRASASTTAALVTDKHPADTGEVANAGEPKHAAARTAPDDADPKLDTRSSWREALRNLMEPGFILPRAIVMLLVLVVIYMTFQSDLDYPTYMDDAQRLWGEIKPMLERAYIALGGSVSVL